MIQLEKYHGKQSRFTCPKCNAKNSFVRYQNEQGEYISFDVGRCNRESSCGYHKKPKDFFAENVQPNGKAFFGSKRQGILRQGVTDENGSNKLKSNYFEHFNSQNNLDVFGQNKKNSASTIEKKYLTQTLGNYENNNFVYFLKTLFTLEIVQSLIDRFAIGTAKDNKTVFWQIDEKGFIRTGRIMLYDKLTGKRSKTVTQNWIHSILQKKKLIKDFQLNQCLFGLHQILIESEKDKTIAIVESDKSAIIATALIPEFVWMSAGSKGYLNAERLKPLANRKVILFPDADAFEDWTNKAKQLRSIVPGLKVSDYLNRILTKEQKEQCYDVTDLLIKKRQQEVWERELYNAKVDAILADENLQAEFNEIIAERIAVMMFDGGLSETEAEKFIYLPENIQPLVLNFDFIS